MENFNKNEEFNYEKYRAYVAAKMLYICTKKTFTVDEAVDKSIEYADKLINKLKNT